LKAVINQIGIWDAQIFIIHIWAGLLQIIFKPCRSQIRGILERTFVPIKFRTTVIITKVGKIFKLLSWMNGKVPVLAAFSRASWPLEENYCQNMLILHSPNLQRNSDIKPEGTSWVDLMKSILLTLDCPRGQEAREKAAKTGTFPFLQKKL
jgi:hypothetical protein